MTTLSQSQIDATAQRLKKELADVDRELAELDDRLVNQAGTLRNDPKEAESLSARVVALQARRVSIGAAQKRNEKEAEKLQKLLSSKEYQKGKAAIADSEKYFKALAADIRDRITKMRELLEQTEAKRTEYFSLLSKFSLDLSPVEKDIRRSSQDLGYLRDILNLLQSQKWMEDRRAALRAQSEEIASPTARAAMDKLRAEQAKRAAEEAKKHPWVEPKDKPVSTPWVVPAHDKPYSEPLDPNSHAGGV